MALPSPLIWPCTAGALLHRRPVVEIQSECTNFEQLSFPKPLHICKNKITSRYNHVYQADLIFHLVCYLVALGLLTIKWFNIMPHLPWFSFCDESLVPVIF